MNRFIAQPIAQVGLMSAIGVVLVAGAALLPAIGPLLVFFFPLPIALVGWRSGVGYALATLVVSVLLAAMFVGPFGAVYTGLFMGAAGIVLGVSARRRWPMVHTLVAMAGALLIGTLLAFQVTQLMISIDLLAQVKAAVAGAIEAARQGALAAGNQEYAQVLEMASSYMARYFALTLPAALISVAFAYAFLVLSLLRPFLRRMNVWLAPAVAFEEWRFPIPFALMFMLGYGGLWAIDHYGWLAVWLEGLSYNLMLLGYWTMMLQGMALLYFLFRFWKLPKIAAGALLVFVLIFFGLGLPLAWIGLADAAFDFRKTITAK
ncbi:MAG: DUF2232 domain-containing protein [Bacillota bacterium]